MLNIENAIKVKERTLQAIRELDAILLDLRGHCSETNFEKIKYGVGRSIGGITMDILDPVLQQHPEIDDLR
ncbi:MAG: hypothetical protein KBD94_00370 [Pyrinomonadaceae bacterium]|nr:hypothetical protein [Pyrinomonadaceae bacterium]